MKFFKKNLNWFLLAFILILATILRILCIDKNGGLWYDELVSYNEASQYNLFEVIKYTLTTDVHLPIYPCFLHLWINLFSFEDVSLRLFSAICGILSVFIIFFAGKEFNNSAKTGLICALIFATNSLLIYYSQEIRLYSLEILFSSLILLYILKIKNAPQNKLNYCILAVLCSLLLNTNTISFIYIISFIVTLFLYLLKDTDRKILLKNTSIFFGIMILLNFATIIYLFNNFTNYTEQINGYYCDLSILFILLQNWFSPVLVALNNNPIHYVSHLKINLPFIIFIIYPIFISLFFIIKGLKKEHEIKLLILIPALIFIASEFIALFITNFKILPRYTILILPNILFILSIGISKSLNSNFLKSLFSLLILINLFYLTISSESAFKINRYGYKNLCNIINSVKINNNDFIVVWNRTEILNKYIPQNNTLSLLKNFAYSSEEILPIQNELNKMSLDNRKAYLRSFFADKNISTNNQYLMNIILQKMNKDNYFILTTTENFDNISRAEFVTIVNDNAKFNRMSFNDLMTIKALLNIKEYSNRIFKLEKIKKDSGFVVYFYKKH